MPQQCSFKYEGIMCPNSPEYIIEIMNPENNDKFMIGLTCSEHKTELESRFKILQRKEILPEGKIHFIRINVIFTQCIKGNQDDIDEITSKRFK